MLNRRSLLLSLAALALPSTALAQPWWDENARQAEWQRYQDEQRHRQGRHQVWNERRERARWEQQRRQEARAEWERQHGSLPGRRTR